MNEGDKFILGYAPLRETRTDFGAITVGFFAGRAYLDKLTLRVVADLP